MINNDQEPIDAPVGKPLSVIIRVFTFEGNYASGCRVQNTNKGGATCCEDVKNDGDHKDKDRPNNKADGRDSCLLSEIFNEWNVVKCLVSSCNLFLDLIHLYLYN